MAVYAAHLTRTLQGTPSVFQVTAQEALGATVKPALRKLVEYLAAVYPDKCGWSERWYDELYLLLDCLVQYHYLKHYAASFSESFYGLVRSPINPSAEFSSGTRLPHALEQGSLLLLISLPYIRDKIDKILEGWRDELEGGRLSKSKKDQARKAAIKLYSIAHFVSEISKLIVLARYLTGKSQAPTLSLQLLGITLKDAPPEDPLENTWGDLFRSIFTGQLSSAVLSFRMCVSACRVLMERGAFVVQLLRWWESRAPAARAALPAPPPARREDTRWVNTCPICLQKWRIPTALPVSGYVFCYTCISRHMRRSGSCPVTSLPAAERSLVRLYLDQ